MDSYSNRNRGDSFWSLTSSKNDTVFNSKQLPLPLLVRSSTDKEKIPHKSDEKPPADVVEYSADPGPDAEPDPNIITLPAQCPPKYRLDENQRCRKIIVVKSPQYMERWYDCVKPL